MKTIDIKHFANYNEPVNKKIGGSYVRRITETEYYQ